MKSMFAVLVLAFAVASVGIIMSTTGVSLAKSDKASDKSVKTDKVAKNDKVNVKQEAKNFEKPVTKSTKKTTGDVVSQKTNASLHKEKVASMGESLEDVVEQEEVINEDVAEEIEEVINESEETADEVSDAIEEVESGNKFKKFLIGTDYKNLGQLRSSLAKNENQIRKLTRTMGSLDETNQAIVQEQLLTLTQERERIKAVITENEGGFSLLGWVFRFLNGYPSEPVDDDSEEDLIDEVQDSIDSEDGTTDDGAVDDGTTDDGTVDDGTVDDGTVDDGTVDDGTTDDGTTDDGTVDDGTEETVEATL